ncbi:MAG: aldo/keto reductase, partial [Prevotella sp.]|nr:aldo/keto reductase [Prevotella sp.]
SIVQIVLRWMMQQDIIMIPKTWNHDYLKENISIFDFELSPEDKARIDSMNRGRWLNYIPLGEQWWLPRHLRKWKGFDEWDNYVKRSSLSKCVTKWFGI